MLTNLTEQINLKKIIKKILIFKHLHKLFLEHSKFECKVLF